MLRSFLVGVAVASVVSAAPGFAQASGPLTGVSAAAPAAVVVPLAPPSGNAVLQTGTEVRFRLLEELTTEDKRLRVGDRFRLEVAEPVLVQGLTVIPVGTPAVGEITEVRNKGMWGKSGKFTARFLYLTVNAANPKLQPRPELPATVVKATLKGEIVYKIQGPPDIPQYKSNAEGTGPIGEITANGTIEIAGPERFRLNELVARYLRATGDSRVVEADPEARYIRRRRVAPSKRGHRQPM